MDENIESQNFLWLKNVKVENTQVWKIVGDLDTGHCNVHLQVLALWILASL